MTKEISSLLEKISSKEDLEEVEKFIRSKIKNNILTENVIENLYVFNYPWKPINNLYYNDYKGNKRIIGWSEYPAGSEPRLISLVPIKTGIMNLVKTSLNDKDGIGNSISCWTDYVENFQNLPNPYIHPLQKEIWRKFLLTEYLEHRFIFDKPLFY